MYNPIKTITSVLIISTFKFVLVFANSEIVLASSRFASNYSCSDTGKVYCKRYIKTNGEKRITIGNSKRNPGGNAMIGILKLIVFCIFYLSASSKVIATSYKDPTSKTNVNAQTDLFRKSVGDVEAFKSQVQEEEREVIEKLRSGVDHGVEFISGTSRKEIDENTAELSTIRADELNDRGRTKLLKENLLEEIYVDESNPLMVAHRKDAERIAEGSKDLLGSLLLSLKERLGVDCYTVKGNKEIEPEHHIKLKEEQIKETVYDQTMCEEPRNQYNCHDALTLRCTKKGMAWNPWQNRTMVKTFGELPMPWWIVGHYTDSSYRGGWKMSCPKWTFNSAYSQEMAAYIAGMIGASLEQIYVGSQNIVIIPLPNRGSINADVSNCHLAWLDYSRALHARVTLHYQYRDGYPICEQWSEDWSETCIFQ